MNMNSGGFALFVDAAPKVEPAGGLMELTFASGDHRQRYILTRQHMTTLLEQGRIAVEDAWAGTVVKFPKRGRKGVTRG